MAAPNQDGSMVAVSRELSQHHLAELQRSRSEAPRALLHEAEYNMQHMDQDLTRQRLQISAMTTVLQDSCDSLKSLSRAASSLMSDVISGYQHAVSALVQRYQTRLLGFEISHERRAIEREEVFRKHEGFLELLTEMIEKDHLKKLENAETEHKHEMEHRREMSSAAELRIRTHQTERLSALRETEENLTCEFKEATDVAATSQKGLLAQARKHSTVLESDNRLVNHLALDVSHLKAELADIQGSVNNPLRSEKERLLKCVKAIKDRIKTQNGNHDKRLVRLACLFDDAKCKLEYEMTILDRIERAWNQCTRLGLAPSFDPDADPLPALDRIRLELLVENSRVEDEINGMRPKNGKLDLDNSIG